MIYNATCPTCEYEVMTEYIRDLDGYLIDKFLKGDEEFIQVVVLNNKTDLYACPKCKAVHLKHW